MGPCCSLSAGAHRSLLPILSYALTSYSKPLVAALAEAGFEVRGVRPSRGARPDRLACLQRC